MEAPEIIWLSPNEYRSNELSCFWSELQRTDYDIEYTRTDSLKQDWKPSEKQMDMLAKVCSTLHLTSGENEIMESLYDGLKKLRGE